MGPIQGMPGREEVINRFVVALNSLSLTLSLPHPSSPLSPSDFGHNNLEPSFFFAPYTLSFPTPYSSPTPFSFCLFCFVLFVSGVNSPRGPGNHFNPSGAHRNLTATSFPNKNKAPTHNTDVATIIFVVRLSTKTRKYHSIRHRAVVTGSSRVAFWWWE